MSINEILPMLAIIMAFVIIASASKQLGNLFEKIKLPLITGFIVIGVLAGPYILNMISADSIKKLDFVNQIALGFIGLAAGAEMYLKEIRERSRQIAIMTTTQIVITFLLGVGFLFIFIDLIPFAQNFTQTTTLAFILLAATIFIAPSLATSIPLVNELRAKGPFTKTALGVTVMKDIFLIIIFAVVYAVSDILISGHELNIFEVLIVLLDIFLSLSFGLVYAFLFKFVIKIKKAFWFEAILFLIVGWSTFLFSDLVFFLSDKYLHVHIHLEAILIGITATFYIVNFTGLKANIQKLVEEIGPYIYVTFFTLVGASLFIESLLKYWLIALGLFALRLVLVFLSSFVGSVISKDSWKETFLSWTPHVAQAGISLGLISIVANHFTSFGKDFEAVLVAMIVINQFVGPPLMKFAIVNLGEAHRKSDIYEFDMQRDVFIIGLEGKAIVLARSLKKANLNVIIISDRNELENEACTDIEIRLVKEINFETLSKNGFSHADSVVILKEENEAFRISELIYENFGTPNIIVRLENRNRIKDFEELGVIIVEPASAMINLLEHFVRSPQATSILLGREKSQITEDVEVIAKDVHGIALRDLKLPLGILVLSLTRNKQLMLPHGYTRLRIGDIVTVVGSQEQIDIVRTKLQFD
ncbi:MAG: cation:proton antiporter [Bacteroidales bacterium]|nr:cation:proton antiporter [Bacteroidales bacterium]